MPLQGLRSDCPNPSEESGNSLPPPPYHSSFHQEAKEHSSADPGAAADSRKYNPLVIPLWLSLWGSPSSSLPPNKCPVGPGRVAEPSGSPADECRAPATEWGWLRGPGHFLIFSGSKCLVHRGCLIRVECTNAWIWYAGHLLSTSLSQSWVWPELNHPA